MSAKLNLASNPFRNRALPWTVAIIVVLTSFIALGLIAKSTVQTSAKIATAQSEINRLQRENNELISVRRYQNGDDARTTEYA